MTSSHWKAPPKLKEPYTAWKEELSIWENFTDIEKKKQGGALFLSLPDPSSARNAVLELGAQVINSDKGVQMIIEKLDSIFLKDGHIATYQAWQAFNKFKRPSSMKMADYTVEFNRLYNACKKNKLELPTGLRVIKYLESANIPAEQHRLALATCSSMDYEAMKSQVLKITTDVADTATATITSNKTLPESEIKVEASTFHAEYYDGRSQDESFDDEDEETYEEREANDTLFGRRYNQHPGNRQTPAVNSRGRYRSRGYSQNPRGAVGGTNRGPGPRSYDNWRRDTQKPTQKFSYHSRNKQPNEPDRFGRPRQCRECMSIYHLEDKCPELENNIVLFTDDVAPASNLLEETLGCLVVDSGCIHTVCGTVWLQSYLESLSCKDRKSVTTEGGSSLFRFGNGKCFRSLKKVTIPIYLGKVRSRIMTDVIDCEIPLLFSKNSLKRGDGSINFAQDTIRILKQDLTLENTSTGHYILRIARSPDSPVSEVQDILFNINIDDMDAKDLHKTALKWHKQFAHPPPRKLLDLLSRAKIDNKQMAEAIHNVSTNCDTCQRYRKVPNKPVVCFPLASRFNETVALDLKDIKPGFKILHMVDHATRYGQAAVVRNKSAQETVKKIFEIWIRIFGCPEKMLVDNGGEFNNREFLELCDKCNIRILTTAAESPWSNGLVEKHDGILGQMIVKTMADCNADPDIATHWAVSAKNALSTVYGFSPNTLVFGHDPNLPNSSNNNIASDDPHFSSELVRNNLNAMHRARESYLHQEAAARLSRALNRQTRTYSDQNFMNGDEVFYKREASSRWQGPAKVLGKDSNQVLVKHGSSYLRVHPCRLIHRRDGSREIQPTDTAAPEATKDGSPPRTETHNISECESDDDYGYSSAATRPSTKLPPNATSVSTTSGIESHLFEVPASNNTSEHSEPSENAVQETTEATSSAVKPKSVDGHTLSVPKKHQIFTYRLKGDTEDRTATCLGRGGKARTATWHYVNIRDSDSQTEQCISVRDHLDSWAPVVEDALTVEDGVFAQPKQAELQKWKEMDIYSEVDDCGQNRISTKWVCTERLKGGKLDLKARLCARGCEDVEDVPTDSPTCERDNVRLLLSIAASFNWSIHSIDFKSAYLQGEDLCRDIFLVPPKEAGTDKLWKLKKCVYGISDAGKKWYNELRKYLLHLGLNISTLDQAVFYRKLDGGLSGMLVLHVDDTLWAGDATFESNIIPRLKQKFLVSTEEHDSMKYLGLSISSDKNSFKMNLNDYAQKLQEIQINPSRPHDDTLSGSDIKQLRIISGQLNWLATQCRPDLSFSSCHAACSIKAAHIKDIKFANKVIRRAKGLDYSLDFLSLGDPRAWRIVCFSDASWGNLPDGGSQGGHLIFIAGQNGDFNLISWQSKRLRRIARSTIAAETLAIMSASESSILLSTQISEILGLESRVPITLVTDNESLANAVRTTTSVEEKRLRIDIAALREMTSSGEIHEVKWVPTEHQLADCLTKQGAKIDHLLSLIKRQSRLDPCSLQLMPSWHE